VWLPPKWDLQTKKAGDPDAHNPQPWQAEGVGFERSTKNFRQRHFKDQSIKKLLKTNCEPKK